MMRTHSAWMKKVALGMMMLAAAMVLALVTGCSGLNSPTASQSATESRSDLWNPQPGDQVVSGRDVPILREDYWESLYGTAVNPWRLPSCTVRIGPMGGILQLGGHTLIVPPGAVSTDVDFRMAYASWSGVGVDCTPSPYTFCVPVTLKLSFIGTQYEDLEGDGEGDDPEDLEILYMAPDGSTQPQASTVDPTTMTVAAELDHFSRYIIG